VKKELDIVKNKTKKVSENCAEELKEPFAGKMTQFIEEAEVQLKDLRELVEDCAVKFLECMKFYNFVPKKGPIESATPEDFFTIWYPFCSDYKNIWKKEQVRIQKEMLKKERMLINEKKKSLQNIEVKKTTASGLKEKLQKRKSSKLSDLQQVHNQEGEGDKGKLQRRKSRLSETSLDSLEAVQEAEPSTSSTPDTPSKAATGLKAKLQQRKLKQETDNVPEQEEY